MHLEARAGTGVLLCAAALAACAPPHNKVLDSYPHDVIGTTSVTYYDVYGRTIAELRASMRKEGPKQNDTSFVGETRSPMRWQWRFQAEGTSSCSIHDIRVLVNTQVLLPRWTPPADTAPGVFAEWNRFIAALETHEAGHKDITAKAASEIVQRVGALSGSCAFIGQRAADIANGINLRLQDQQREYDAVTRHGLTQGTAFGLPRGPIGTAMLAQAPITLPGGGGQLFPRPGTLYGNVPWSTDSVWRVLPAAFAAAGVPMTTSDSATHVVVFFGLVHLTIGDEPLATYFDCGAAADDMSLTVAAAVRPDTVGKSITIVMTDATTRVKGATQTCRSTAALERRVAQAIRAQLVKVAH